MNNIANFASNKKYWQLINKLVFGEAISCPVCGLKLKENYQLGYLWCKSCRKKYRATAYKGSWLYGMKIKPRQLFILLWCWQQKKSTEATMLKAEVSYTTVTRWQTRFRCYLPSKLPILDDIVQVDESYFGKRRHQQPQLIVVGAISPRTKHLVLKITGSYQTGRSRLVLEQFVQDTIRPNSLVVTDKWQAYSDLPLLGYEHETWNHQQSFLAGTNQIENVWSVVKRHQRKLTGGRLLTKQLPSLCQEWMARANQPELFNSPIEYLRFTLVPC